LYVKNILVQNAGAVPMSVGGSTKKLAG